MGFSAGHKINLLKDFFNSCVRPTDLLKLEAEMLFPMAEIQAYDTYCKHGLVLGSKLKGQLLRVDELLFVEVAVDKFEAEGAMHHRDKDVKEQTVVTERNGGSCFSGVALALVEAKQVGTGKLVAVHESVLDLIEDPHYSNLI